MEWLQKCLVGIPKRHYLGMYSLSIGARHACRVYSRSVMALRNAWLAFLNTVTKIELTLATPPRNTNHDSPNMITDQIRKRMELPLHHFS
jgi:hypothetical protein